MNWIHIFFELLDVKAVDKGSTKPSKSKGKLFCKYDCKWKKSLMTLSISKINCWLVDVW